MGMIRILFLEDATLQFQNLAEIKSSKAFQCPDKLVLGLIVLYLENKLKQTYFEEAMSILKS